jgi:hypothetical protein
MKRSLFNSIHSSKKRTIGAHGSPFKHDISSCLGRPPTHHIWDFSPEARHEIVVFMDERPMDGAGFPARFKFLWLCESKEVKENAWRWVRDNYLELANIYRLIFVHDESLLELGHPFKFAPPASNLPWIRDPGVYMKTKLVSMVSSGKSFTAGHRRRNVIFDEIGARFQFVERFGRSHCPFDKKEDVLSHYMYHIAIENSIYDCYATEKVMDCFATGAIPVYLGSKRAISSFNQSGIIYLDDLNKLNELSVDHYNSCLSAVHENFQLCADTAMADDIVYRLIVENIES